MNTVVRLEDLSPGEDLADALEGVPGLRVRDQGSRKTLALRGADDKQVLVLLDGVPLSSPMGLGVDLSLLSPIMLDRAEIRRSAGSARYGSGALGGALVLQTPRLRAKEQTTVALSAGSFSSVAVHATRQGNLGPLRYWAGGSFRRSDGTFRYIDENGADRLRLNNDSQSGEVLLKLDYLPASSWHLGAFNSFVIEERGAPGLSQRPSETARQLTARNLTAVKASRLGVFSLPAAELAITVDHRYQQFRFSEISAPPVQSNNHSFSAGGRVELILPLGHIARVELGASARGDFFRDPNTNNPTRASIDTWFGGEQVLFAKRVVLSEHLRVAWASGFEPVVIPKFGLALRPLRGAGIPLLEGIEIVGNVGRSFRYPTFEEMYVELDGFGPNPDLLAEDAVVADVGLRLRHPRVAIEAGYFFRQMKNTILFAPVSSFLVRADNYSKVGVRGLESTAEFFPGLCFAGQLTYTLTEAEFGSPAMRLPGRPIHRFFGRAEWQGTRCSSWRSTSFASKWLRGLRLWASVTVESEMPLSRFDSTWEEGRILLAAGARYRYRWLTASIAGYNLLDKRDALDTVGFPLAPARIWASLKGAF
jgi:outer membrane receptor protein involved in Fe transport